MRRTVFGQVINLQFCLSEFVRIRTNRSNSLEAVNSDPDEERGEFDSGEYSNSVNSKRSECSENVCTVPQSIRVLDGTGRQMNGANDGVIGDC